MFIFVPINLNWQWIYESVQVETPGANLCRSLLGCTSFYNKSKALSLCELIKIDHELKILCKAIIKVAGANLRKAFFYRPIELVPHRVWGLRGYKGACSQVMEKMPSICPW